MFVTATVNGPDGKPVADAEVDIWQSSTEGLYENQDPTQADMNLRGKFTTDANGRFSFRSILPAGSSVMINIDDGSGYCVFDFKAVFEDGEELEKYGNNVCELAVFNYTE